ncbi:MAG TPA: D-alanyl-D-alanine carboxypeptidase/D-alanyl-D-alanine-endopeptidase [bacterium]|nr:D-alanyl-D-alanine carboxypeptidase/D-alanyl-D-alanine-endopeptidase [bacterium]
MAAMKCTTLSLVALLCAGCASSPASGLARLLPVGDGPAQVSALVVDLDTGEVLFAREPRRLFRPASTMKLLTTAAVCRRDLAGNLTTRLVADAVPRGHVRLVGGCDPMLSSDDLRAMAAELHRAGLRHAHGPIVVEDPLLGEPRFGAGWMWDDEPSPFQPPTSGITVDAACVTVELRAADGEPEVRVLPVAGELEVAYTPVEGAFSVRRGRYRRPNRVVATGSLADGKTTARERITVPDPARHAGYVLVEALRAAGVTVDDRVSVEVVGPGRGRAAGVAAESVRVRPLAEVVTFTNKVSDNLGAEHLQRHVGRAAVCADLQELGVGERGYRIADGSGVSHYNLLSADILVRELVAMHRLGGRAFEVFRGSLPVAGVDGTLRSRMRGTAAEGRVFAKTGTISAVSNLAGYVDTLSGRRLAFAILCQHFVGSARRWRDLQDRFCAELATW